jgi:plastocyanin
MGLLRQASAFVCALAVLSWGATVKAADEEERTAICADAQARFEAFKDLPPDEALPPAKSGTVHVLMLKYTFCPSPLTVKVGTTVRFVNVEKRTSHSVWFKEAGKAESERLFPVEFWEQTFETPGRYPYLCGPHWEQQDMKGVLNVIE